MNGLISGPTDERTPVAGGIADGVEERGVAGKASDGKARRKRLAQRVEHIKDERCSPDADRPDSPGLARTPPMDGLHASRNYSDFMRSLAAKYNNNSVTAAAADYGRFDARLFKASLPEPGSSASAAISALAAFPQFAFPRQADDSLKRERDYVNPFALPGLDPAHPALPGFPAMDMSSTQALLSMVRSASSVGSAGSVRDARPARRPDAAAPHSPLDLSAQPVKRALGEPRLDVDSLPAKKKYLHAEERLASPREKRTPTPKTGQLRCRSACPADGCGAAASELSAWSVGEVVDFVRDIDLCAEYAEVSRVKALSTPEARVPEWTERRLTDGAVFRCSASTPSTAARCPCSRRTT